MSIRYVEGSLIMSFENTFHMFIPTFSLSFLSWDYEIKEDFHHALLLEMNEYL